MTDCKNIKKAMLASVLSVVLCCAMLVGSTFAWFTDSVTSAGNIIKSGTLDVTMEWADGTQSLTDPATKWEDASKGAIFNYDLWEPGYTEVRHVKISNVGSLALKYEIRITATGEVSELADVIDVYYIKDGRQITNRAGLTDADKIGTLSDILKKPCAAKGHISGKSGETVSSDTATIALKMQESAGNKYQDMSIGSEFAIQLVATQYTEESDSFGPDYDAGAKYPILITKGITKNEDNLLTEAIVLGAESADLVSENAPVHVEVPANVAVQSDATDFTLRIEPTVKDPNVTVNTVSEAIAYKIEMPLAAANSVPVPVTMFIGQELDLTAVYHNEIQMTDENTGLANTYQYDPASGVVTMYITHCSTFTFITGPKFAVGNFSEFQSALNDAEDGDTIVLIADVNPTTNFTFNKSIIVDMNGYGFVRATEASGGYGIILKPGCDLTMKNGRWDMAGTFGDIKAEGRDGSCNVMCENVVFTNLDNPTKDELAAMPGNSSNLVKTAFKANMQGDLTVKATFKECTFNNASVEFSGFNSGNTYTAEFSHCTFNNIGNAGAIAAKSYGMTDDCAVTVTDCTFNITVTSNVKAIASERKVTLNLTNNVVDGTTADPSFYKVFDSTSLKFYGDGSVTESGTTLKGIAVMN